MKTIERKFYKFLIKSNIFHCPVCGEKNHSCFNRLCKNCRSKLKFVPQNSCYSCGGELDGALALCTKCLKEKKRAYLRGITLMPYGEFNRELILSYKQGGKTELARFFARLMANKIRRENLDFDIICAVPLHWTKKFSRGFNQSELLAELIAKNLNKIFEPKAITRIKKGLAQKELKSSDRHKNLRGAFRADPNKVKGKKVLLVDDIFTTGATLDNTAIALKKAGASLVYVISIGRA